MEIQSLFIGKKLIRPQNIETTAFGAALIAGSGAQVFDVHKRKLNPIDKAFKKTPKKIDIENIESYRAFFKSLKKSPFLDRSDS
jgi:glycerol kinase